MVDVEAAVTVALENTRVVDVERGRYYTTGVPAGVRVVLRGGRVVALPGLPGEPEAPAGARRLDLGGRALLPGAVNTHAHLQLCHPALAGGWRDLVAMRQHTRAQLALTERRCLAHGVTTVRDTWSEDLRPNRRRATAVRAGTAAGPRIVPSVIVSPAGGAFAPRRNAAERALFAAMGSPTVPYERTASGVVTFPPGAGVRQVRAAVDEAIDRRGARTIKLYDQREKRLGYCCGATMMHQRQLDAAADQARRRGVPTTMHHFTVESFRRGVRAGVTSLAHLPGDAWLGDADVADFLAAGCLLEPTATLAYYLCYPAPGATPFAPERWRRLSALREDSWSALAERFWEAPLRRHVVAGHRRALSGRRRAYGFLDLHVVYRYYAGLLAEGPDNLAALVAAGAPIALGNDAGAVPCTAAMLQHEVTLLRFLLSLRPDGPRFDGPDAVRAATLNGARALGLDGEQGRVAVGQRADLIVLDGDPLADPSLLGAPTAATFRAGRLVRDRCGLAEQA